MKRKIYVQEETNDYLEIDSPIAWLMQIGDLGSAVRRYQLKFCPDLTDEDMETLKDVDRICKRLDDAYFEIENFVSKKFVKGMNGEHFTRELE